MTDNRDDAEFLDGDALGEEVGDEELPGTEGFPPDRPWGVEDPTRDVGVCGEAGRHGPVLGATDVRAAAAVKHAPAGKKKGPPDGGPVFAARVRSLRF